MVFVCLNFLTDFEGVTLFPILHSRMSLAKAAFLLDTVAQKDSGLGIFRCPFPLHSHNYCCDAFGDRNSRRTGTAAET